MQFSVRRVRRVRHVRHVRRVEFWQKDEKSLGSILDTKKLTELKGNFSTQRRTTKQRRDGGKGGKEKKKKKLTSSDVQTLREKRR